MRVSQIAKGYGMVNAVGTDLADEKAEKRLESKAGMTKHEIEIEWKKPGITSADERAKYLRIPRSTLYKMFGPSGASAGRRPKHLLET